MKILTPHINDVRVPPDRARERFDQKAHDDLVSSIETVGLLHPLTVDCDSDGYWVRAGVRRLMALRAIIEKGNLVLFGGTYLTEGTIPVILYSDLTPERALEIELDENIHRLDFTWQERAKLVAKLHKFRTERDPNWNLSKTAKELDQRSGLTASSPSLVLDRIKLAEMIDSDPVIRAAPSERQAIKLLYQKIESQLVGARSRGKETHHRIEQCDAAEGINSLPAESVDVIVTDPPYGINIGASGALAAYGPGHIYDDSVQTFRKTIESFFGALERAAKPDAHLYCFCDFEHYHWLAQTATSGGWTVWSRPLIWVKNTAIAADAMVGPLCSYECILYAYRPGRPLNAAYSDVITYPIVQHKDYGPQKPVELYVDLLRRSARPGDTVLDPFCGSGPMIEAANQLKLTAICFDISEQAINLTRGRL